MEILDIDISGVDLKSIKNQQYIIDDSNFLQLDSILDDEGLANVEIDSGEGDEQEKTLG